ncbi:hypothetical protein C3943_22120 [Lysinibacillus sp. B2A1]|nr:hypothetical protein C3943_22120 [Lysinibacillus sp. B2A1]
MHAIDLVDTLKDFLQDKLKDMELQTKVPETFKAPTVYAGYLPPKPSRRERDEETDPEDYPFVIVRILGHVDKIHDKKTIAVRIIIGTYSKDEQNGWRENVNVWNHIELALKEMQVVGPFNLAGQIDFDLFEEQMRPSWHSSAVVEFEAPQLQWDRSVLKDEF